jgi:hypothetical protein
MTEPTVYSNGDVTIVVAPLEYDPSVEYDPYAAPTECPGSLGQDPEPTYELTDSSEW